MEIPLLCRSAVVRVSLFVLLFVPHLVYGEDTVVITFEHIDFNQGPNDERGAGKVWRNIDIPWIGNFWNDKISSIIVTGSNVTFCEHVNYAGSCKELTPGWYRWVEDAGIRNDSVSSFKRGPISQPPPTVSNGTIVPLYTYPTHASWNAIINAKNGHPTVEVVAIVNPASGPGATLDPVYTQGIANLRNAGIKVLGYVHTCYGNQIMPNLRDCSGNRTLDKVKAEINDWKSIYPQIDGIFFDEMANTSGHEDYYKSLSTYAKATHGFTLTVGNPGADTLPSYVGTVDVILIYEGVGLPDVNALAGWHANHNRSNFGIIPHDVPTLNANFVSAAKQSVKYQYLTNDSTIVSPSNPNGNPWDSLSNYFDALLATLQ